MGPLANLLQEIELLDDPYGHDSRHHDSPGDTNPDHISLQGDLRRNDR
jgi:hypothetical protein